MFSTERCWETQAQFGACQALLMRVKARLLIGLLLYILRLLSDVSSLVLVIWVHVPVLVAV